MSDNRLIVSDAVCKAVRELVLASTDYPSDFLVTDEEIRQIAAEEAAAHRANQLDAARVQLRASPVDCEADLSAVTSSVLAKISTLDFKHSGASGVEETQDLPVEDVTERRTNRERSLEAQLRKGDSLIEIPSTAVSLGMIMEELGLSFSKHVGKKLKKTAQDEFRAAGWIAGRKRKCFSDDDGFLEDKPSRPDGYRGATWLETLLFLKRVGLDKATLGASCVISGKYNGHYMTVRLVKKRVDFDDYFFFEASKGICVFVRELR